MNITEMFAAVRDAKEQLANADAVATSLAKLLVGRLRKVDNDYILAELKRELSRFNIKTKRWNP